MAEIYMLVTSIDPLAAYKVSDDLIVELVNVTATVEDDSEGCFSGHVVGSDYRTSQIGQTPTARRVYARQPPSPNDLCQKRGSQPWRPNKIQDRSITGMGSSLKRLSSVICC
jgi:hypothetical protein